MNPVVPLPRAHPRPLQAFWRALTQFDRKKISLSMGVRNAIGIVLPLAVGVHLGYPGSGLVAATGAINVAAADGVDSYRSRAVRMLASSLIGAIGVYLGALAARNDIAVVAVRALWAFAAGLVVCLGTVAGDIGMISLVVIVIYTAQSMTPSHAAWSGLIAFGAGVLQTALSIASWPIRGRQPERNVIGDFYLELAKAATVPANPFGAPLASQQSTQAQEALSSLAGDHSVEAERLLLLVSQAERIRLSLFALGRNQARIRREDADAPSAAVIDRFLEPASSILSSIGASLRGEPLSDSVSAFLEEADGAAEVLRQSEEHPEHSALQKTHLSEARIQMDALAGQLRAALDLARSTTPAGEAAFAAREVRAPWRLRLSGWLATLRANLSLDSSACRHAIRLALCVVLGEIIARSFSLPRSYWLAMTVALVLKPDFGNTFSRGVLRLAGTYAGLMLATILFHLVSPATSIHVVWIGILAFTLRSLGRANYGITVTAISAMIVFLFSLNGVAPKDVIAARALNTTIGGALALVIYLVWPTREQTQVPQALASMLDAYRLYFRALSRAYIHGRSLDPQELDRLRVNGRRARSNVETSVDRLTAEPYVDAAQLRLLNAMLASSHRFAHSAMALEAGLASGPFAPAGDASRTFSQDLEKFLYFLAQLLRGSQVTPESLPNLREDHNRLIRSRDGSDGRNAWLNIETDRMTNSLNTLAEQLFRYSKPRA
jgi:uncharacterized membrane protein YccC